MYEKAEPSVLTSCFFFLLLQFKWNEVCCQGLLVCWSSRWISFVWSVFKGENFMLISFFEICLWRWLACGGLANYFQTWFDVRHSYTLQFDSSLNYFDLYSRSQAYEKAWMCAAIHFSNCWLHKADDCKEVLLIWQIGLIWAFVLLINHRCAMHERIFWGSTANWKTIVLKKSEVCLQINLVMWLM